MTRNYAQTMDGMRPARGGCSTAHTCPERKDVQQHQDKDDR
jgi:riboflavin biosynthesis pyrimidine reductase